MKTTDLTAEILKEYDERYFPQVDETFGIQLKEFIAKALHRQKEAIVKELLMKIDKLEEWVEIPDYGVKQEEGGPFVFKIDVLKKLDNL